MGQSRWIADDQIQRKRTPSFPSDESIVPRNAQKPRRWEIIDTLLCRWGYDWNWFFAQLFLLISSVSTEQSQICTDAGFLKTVEVGQYFMTRPHWRVLTIYRTSDMSWVHFATRWNINWPERLDSWAWKLRIESVTRESEFLMDWTS